MTEPRRLRPVQDPLGSYLRPSNRDHTVLTQMLVEGLAIGTGLVADPALATRQKDLLGEARRQGVETVLDPRSLDLSTPGGFARSGAADLPWAGEQPHTPADLRGGAGALMARQLAAVVDAQGHTAVLAPAHYVASGTDPWLAVDADLTRALRAELDRAGHRQVPIYYPLIVKAAVLNDPRHREQLIAHLATLPIDALWLRVHPFGTATAGPLALRRYLETARQLHTLGVPLVAEHTGTVGVALLAFGAVGGIESGITMTDRTNLDGWLKPPTGGGFLPAPRVYLHEIGAFVKVEDAAAFYENKGMKSAHGCQHTGCCPGGWRDTLSNPRRHFVAARAREVARLSTVPQPLRPGQYMENFLRPATDKAVRAAQAAPSLETARARLESWRGTLGAQLTEHSTFTVSPPAAGRRHRRSA